MRAATYLRVSTNGQNLEPQRLRLADYAKARGLELVAEYTDRGISGRRDRRAGLDALRRDARRHAFDAVLVVKLDRIARSTRHLCELAEELEAAGVDLVAADQPFDTSTAAGKLLFGVLAVVAQFEADLIRERTLAGLEAARRRGAKLGRPPVLDARARARARRMHAGGQSARSIASVLGVSVQTITRALNGRR
jgi:DNA invertase Pin-like site-specific DNA recombinase